MTHRSLSNRALRRSPGRAVIALCASTMLLCAASCGGNDPDNGDGPTDPSPTSTTTSGTTEPTPTEPTNSGPASDEYKAAAALLSYLDVRDKAYATGRISKKLNKYATGQEHFGLQQFVMTLNNQAKAHFVGQWSHEVVRLRMQTENVAEVTDCEDGRQVQIVRRSDGTELPWFTFDGSEVPRRLEQTYRLILEGDLWKVQQKTSLASEVKSC